MAASKDQTAQKAHDGARGPNGGAADAAGASIDKVRDLLFGGQMREVERRFSQLEERMLKESHELKEHLKARLDALEKFTKKETESLAEKIKGEHGDRVDADTGLSRELKDTHKSLEKRTAALDDQLAKSQREIRQQILEQGQRLSEDIRKRIDDVLKTMAQESQSLRSDKTDRTALAALLNEMAMRLTGEIPAGPAAAKK